MDARRMEHMGEEMGKGSPGSDMVSPYKEPEVAGFFNFLSYKMRLIILHAFLTACHLDSSFST